MKFALAKNVISATDYERTRFTNENYRESSSLTNII